MARFVYFILMYLVSLCMNLFAQTAEMPVLHLKGTPFERGYFHGSQLKPAIAEVYAKWKDNMGRETQKNPDSVIDHFLASSRYLETIVRETPAVWEELKGLAAGSGQSLKDVFAFQLIDEYWGYLDRLEHHSIDKDHCSAIGIAANGKQPTLVAQNIDIDNFMNGYQVLFHIEETTETPEQYIMGCAGFLGFAGMNNKGVAVVINALTDLNNSVEGLPVTFVTRGILQQTSGEKALYFVKDIKHATGQNYLIGTQEDVYTLEASANKVVEVEPQKNKVVYHTNHSLENHDVKPWMQDYHKHILAGTGRQTNSQTRLQSLKQQVATSKGNLDAAKVKEILRSKENEAFPICVKFNPNGIAFTFSSVVFTLGEQPTAEVTVGPPDTAEYIKYHFTQNILE